MPQLTDAGDLISASWDNLVKNIGAYAHFAVWYTFLAVLQWALFVVGRSMISETYLRNAILTLTYIPVAVATAAVTASMIAATAQGVQKKAIDVRASFSQGIHQLIPYIWVSIICFFVYLGGLLLFVIPIFIFAVWFWFAQYYTVLDDVRGTAALKASKKLVKGRWWPVALRILLPAIFCGVAAAFLKAVLYLLIGSVFGNPGMFFGQLADASDISSTHMLIISVLPTIVNAFAIPLYIGTTILLWMDLKKSMR